MAQRQITWINGQPFTYSKNIHQDFYCVPRDGVLYVSIKTYQMIRDAKTKEQLKELFRQIIIVQVGGKPAKAD